MRYPCYTCGKCVTSELPDDSIIRAELRCPECIEVAYQNHNRLLDACKWALADKKAYGITQGTLCDMLRAALSEAKGNLDE